MLRREVRRLLAEVVLRAWQGYVDTWIAKYGQEGLDRLVEEDKDAIRHLRETRPDLLSWLPRVRRVVSGEDIDVDGFTDRICEYLAGRGLTVTDRHRGWIRREIKKIRDLLS